MSLQRTMDGVRPSPGAATSELRYGSRKSSDPMATQLAAPEDGRTPKSTDQRREEESFATFLWKRVRRPNALWLPFSHPQIWEPFGNHFCTDFRGFAVRFRCVSTTYHKM